MTRTPRALGTYRSNAAPPKTIAGRVTNTIIIMQPGASVFRLVVLLEAGGPKHVRPISEAVGVFHRGEDAERPSIRMRVPVLIRFPPLPCLPLRFVLEVRGVWAASNRRPPRLRRQWGSSDIAHATECAPRKPTPQELFRRHRPRAGPHSREGHRREAATARRPASRVHHHRHERRTKPRGASTARRRSW